MKSVEATDILPDIQHKPVIHHKMFSDTTCVKDVASLTEKGTSSTLASVRASKVLPNRGKAHPFITNKICTPEPVGPLPENMYKYWSKVQVSVVHHQYVTLLKCRHMGTSKKRH